MLRSDDTQDSTDFDLQLKCSKRTYASTYRANPAANLVREAQLYRELVFALRGRHVALGLDQQDLCAVMGMADGYVNKLESFAKMPRPATLLLWIQCLGLEVEMRPFTGNENPISGTVLETSIIGRET